MADRNDSELFAIARDVVDPMLFHTLGELDTLVAVAADGDAVGVVVRMPGEEHRAGEELGRRLSLAFGGADVDLTLVAMTEEEMGRLGETLRQMGNLESAEPANGGSRPNQFAKRRSGTRVLAISSGKGGVGKSSVTVNLAVGLAELGHRVGLLDADIYGFSVPRMIGVPYPPIMLGRTIVPPVARQVRTISMGFFVDEDQAVAWRGPMLHKAIEQFLVDVHWGTLDYLVVDLPPGTGDVALSIAQQLPGAELYVVTTPQPASQRVAQRTGALARQVRMPIRGVIENMSWFTAPDGTRHELFGSGGGAALAAALEVPLLAQIPLDPAVREGADNGEPASVAAPGSAAAEVFTALAGRIAELGPSRVYRSELSVS